MIGWEYLHFGGHPRLVPDVDHPRALTVVGEDSVLLEGSPYDFSGFTTGVYPLEIVTIALCLHGSKYAKTYE
jgi:hypothetical protein